MNTRRTSSTAETEALAAEIAAGTPFGTIITLRGELGAGKTAFARGFARGIGVAEPVSSPTFTIAQEYILSNGKRLYHLDLYRINDSAAALAFGIEEFLDDPDAICLIEWPERIDDILPPGTPEVIISHLDENSRTVSWE